MILMNIYVNFHKKCLFSNVFEQFVWNNGAINI